jgi:NADH-quinone oxidoreductase subunit H
MVRVFFNYLIFPGFLFSACFGLLTCWLDRKLSARLQWRLGPPWYQGFMDICKLFGKETILPSGATITFILAPCLGFLAAILSATILGTSLWQTGGFGADLIVVLYLLMIPAVALIMGASSSANPLASVGASREMKLVLGYELPFILSVLAIVTKGNGAIRFQDIISQQQLSSSNIFSWSGTLAFLAVIFCVQAKLGFGPFEISEAEQEIMGGALIEYSGSLLAIFKLTKAVLFYTLPLLVIVLFLGKDTSLLFLALKYLGIVLIFILVKNTNPRLRIDQAVRFFWGPVTLLALVSLILSLLGY